MDIPITAGPWTATRSTCNGQPQKYFDVEADCGGWMQSICMVFGNEGAAEANAHLIAAAPELLTAAQAAFTLLEAIGERVNRGERDRDYHEERNALRAAIAKAEGR